MNLKELTADAFKAVVMSAPNAHILVLAFENEPEGVRVHVETSSESQLPVFAAILMNMAQELQATEQPDQKEKH